MKPPRQNTSMLATNKRRWILTRIVQGFTVSGLAFLTYPFVKSWVPSFTEDTSLDVPLETLKPGEARLIRWRGRNIYVQRRTRAMQQTLETSELVLKDPDSLASSQPAFAANGTRSLRDDIFVGYSNCTHLGCEVAAVNDAGIGFKCPCHHSDYDLAGRVLEDAAAPLNLEIPNYRFVSGNIIRLETVTV